MDHSVQEEIKRRFGVQVIKQHEKYLGLPSLVGRKKRRTFNDIKEKLAKRLAGWKEKLRSMSCFKLLDTLCEELMSMICNFWWGQK